MSQEDISSSQQKLKFNRQVQKIDSDDDLPQTFESDDDIPSDEQAVEEIALDKFKALDDEEEKKLTPETKGSSAATIPEEKRQISDEE